MIIDDFDTVDIAFAELETDPPRTVYGHGPLSFAVAFELVKPHTFEWAQIVERLGDIQRQELIDGSVDIQSAKLFRPAAFPDFTARRIQP